MKDNRALIILCSAIISSVIYCVQYFQKLSFNNEMEHHVISVELIDIKDEIYGRPAF